MEFSVHIEAGGQEKQIDDFGSTYVTRKLFLNIAVDPNTHTVVRYDPATGSLAFVPALFAASGDGTWVTAKRTGTSVYAVVGGTKTFGDIAGHWAEHAIAQLASKRVVFGAAADRCGELARVLPGRRSHAGAPRL